MAAFPADDEPGAGRPVVEVDQVGELGHGGVGSFAAVLVDGGVPAVVVEADPADGGVDLAVGVEILDAKRLLKLELPPRQ